uniref:Protein SDA1 n=1 Tax=Vombatus ursinus TaxID=29139 RepID=A0A4X2K6F8_VOMUR
MSARNNNKQFNNLLQLQNLIKWDPSACIKQFMQQSNHYKSSVEIFRLQANKPSKELDAFVIFLYPFVCVSYFPVA